MIQRARMLGGLFLISLAVRAIEFPTVVTKAGVQLPRAGDAYYHLRRIWYSVARFPDTLPVDSYVSFPSGSQIIWPSAFDWTIAALIRPFVDPADQTAVESIAIWVPAVLGAVTACVLALLTERAFGRSSAWFAGLIYGVLPMSYGYSHLGMIDHHVAVALFTTVMLWLAFEIFARDDRTSDLMEAFRFPSTRIAVAMGVAMAATISMWPGALLHVAILQVAFLFRWLAARSRDAGRARAIQFAASQAVVGMCIAPLAVSNVWREYGDWSPLVLTNFQPAYFGSAALATLVIQLVHDRSRMGEARPRRVVSAFCIFSTGVMAMLFLIAPLRDALVYAGGWFTGGEELLGMVNETRPLLAMRGRFAPGASVDFFGAGLSILPFVWLHFARRAVTQRDSPLGLLLFWALAFIVLTLQQWRFGNTLAVVYAMLIGACLAEWGQSLRGRIALRPIRPLLEVAIVIALMAWSVVSFSRYYTPLLRVNLAALQSPARREMGPLKPAKVIYDRAGRWIAQNTPKTSGYLDPDQSPEYAVLSDWSTGHLLRYRSERPMVQDNFGPYAGRESFEAAWAYFAESDEEAAIRILERLGVRYVIGGNQGAGSMRGLPPEVIARRLVFHHGSRKELPSGTMVPGLTRHRLIFYARAALPGSQQLGLRQRLPNSSIGVWEIVPGARIEGRAAPDAAVRLDLDLETKSRLGHVYHRETIADERGVYQFVVPYPTDESDSSAIRTRGDYRISTATAHGQLTVREEDVMAGEVLAGPDLSGSARVDSSGGS